MKSLKARLHQRAKLASWVTDSGVYV